MVQVKRLSDKIFLIIILRNSLIITKSNNLTRDLLGGRSGFAVYDYSHGERLTTQHPAYINNQSTFFIQIVTLPQRYIQRLTILSLTKERKLSSYLL